MSDFILYHPRVAYTGRALSRILDIKGGSAVKGPVNKLIRWGYATKANATTEINSRSAILNASHKYNALATMKKNGVSIPHFSRNVSEVKFPCIVRTDSHFGGKGFGLILQKNDVKHWANRGVKDYFIEYMPCNVEYRVHVFNNEVVRIQRKNFSLELLRAYRQELNIHETRFLRNHNNCWVFQGVLFKSVPAVITENAIKSISALGLTFGAADIIHGDDGKAYVLEVNTAPGLQAESTLSRYAASFMKWLGKEVDSSFDQKIQAEVLRERIEMVQEIRELGLIPVPVVA